MFLLLYVHRNSIAPSRMMVYNQASSSRFPCCGEPGGDIAGEPGGDPAGRPPEI